MKRYRFALLPIVQRIARGGNRHAVAGASLSALPVALTLLCACNAVLGIEELKVKPDASTASAEQGQETANVSAAAGAKASTPSADKTGTAGTRADAPERMNTAVSGAKAPDKAAADSSMQPAAAGAAGSSALATAGTSGGTAGAPAEVAGPVTGTIVDYRGRKLPGISVRIGDQQTTSDSAGQFTFAEVPSSYDVTLLIQTIIRNNTASLVWQFQGLHRRDPTLQVYRALPERYGEVMIHVDNTTFPLASNQTIFVGWSSQDGDFTLEISSADTHYLSPIWSGPVMTTGAAHAFLVSTERGVPTEYLAHATAGNVLMTADMTGQMTLDLGGEKPEVGMITGTVTGPALGQRRNEVYLRFNGDDTALQLVNQWEAVDSFTYPVPSLPDSKLTVVAKSGSTPGGFGAAYAEVEPGGPALALELPALPLLAAPEEGKANVDGSSMFQWNSDARVFVLAARAVDYFDSIYVVTESKQARLPIGAELGYTPRANAAFEWSVEVHDAYTSVDEATGPAGHLSAYGTDVLRGPRRGAGKYAQSVPRLFTTPQ